MERAKGLDGNNFVTVALREKGMGIQEPGNYTGAELRRSSANSSRMRMPSFGKIADNDVLKYVFTISQ